MNLDVLRWFIAVAEHGHLTRASETLHVSQPALSRAIARLEQELEVALFDRHGRGLRLNRYGELYLRAARRTVHEADLGRKALADAVHPERGVVALGFAPTLGRWFLPAILAAFRDGHPAVSFQLSQDSTERLAAGLRQGDVDILFTSPPAMPDGLGWHPLLTERLQLAVPPGHRLARRARIRLAEVTEEPFVLLKPGLAFRTHTDQICREAGFQPRGAFEAEDVATLRGLVATGLGVALVPPAHRSTGDLPDTVHDLDLVDRSAKRVIGMAWDDSRFRSPVTEVFRRFVIRRGRAVAERG